MVSKTDSTKTLFTISIGFIVIYLITGYNWAIITSLIVGLIGILSNNLSSIIVGLWMKLSKLLSFIVPNILLSIFYFLILFPVAILSRIFGKSDTLNLKNIKKSTFINKRDSFEKSQFEKTW